ncbi:MAG: efflux RND transporter periplasmic adaptor subunit [Candidatus Eisenbacteria bacterium]|nr:efflux RND transporter periplasmic adaptor subunit [Candidatus Eisenbacteria bacterium]
MNPEREPHTVHEPPPGAAFMNTVRWVLFGGLSLLAVISIASFVAFKVQQGKAPTKAERKAGATTYRCPMHPNYTSDKPGECPICGMNLEAVEVSEAHAHDATDGGVPGLTTVQIPSERTQLIGVRLARAERGGLGEGSPLVGFVSPDETRLRRVQLRVSGWVKNVAMNRTGEQVRAGQPMLSIYSPELYQSEQEYLIALGGTEGMMQHDAGAHESARERLRLLGVPDDEVARLERERKPSSNLALRSPVTGTILERNVVEGQFIGADTPLFTVADLSRVWVLVDLYEMDLGRVRVGDRARFTADGLPGREFSAAIDFVYPTVSSETRTLKARLSLANSGGLLKPGMYGQVDVANRTGSSALVVPAEAVVNTGEYSYVFIARAGGTFEPRRVWTGRGDGERITVLKGLAVGDTVVASASFLIDSESRLKAAIAGIGGVQPAGGAGASGAGAKAPAVMPPGHQH